MKRYRLQLPAQARHVILALANLTQEVDSAQGEIFKQTVCAVTPVELCGWILADALYNQNYQLLRASNVLGIDSLALNSLPSHGDSKQLLGSSIEAGLRVVVRAVGLRIYWFKREDFLSLVAMLSHRIIERTLEDRHSAESRDIGNVHLLSHRI